MMDTEDKIIFTTYAWHDIPGGEYEELILFSDYQDTPPNPLHIMGVVTLDINDQQIMGIDTDFAVDLAWFWIELVNAFDDIVVHDQSSVNVRMGRDEIRISREGKTDQGAVEYISVVEPELNCRAEVHFRQLYRTAFSEALAVLKKCYEVSPVEYSDYDESEGPVEEIDEADLYIRHPKAGYAEDIERLESMRRKIEEKLNKTG